MFEPLISAFTKIAPDHVPVFLYKRDRLTRQQLYLYVLFSKQEPKLHIEESALNLLTFNCMFLGYCKRGKKCCIPESIRLKCNMNSWNDTWSLLIQSHRDS